MKVLLVLFLICVHAFCFAVGFFYGSEHSLDFNSVERAIRNKCVTEDKLEDAIDEFGECATSGLQKDHPISFDALDSAQDYCNFFDDKIFRKCLKNFTRNISPCLAENEMYLQKFILNSFDVAREEFCGINGVSNFQYFINKINGTDHCMSLLQYLFVYHGACNTAHLNIFKHLDKGVLNLNKPNVCSDLESLQKCTTPVMEGICNTEYSRFTDLIFNPFFKNCNDLDSKK